MAQIVTFVPVSMWAASHGSVTIHAIPYLIQIYHCSQLIALGCVYVCVRVCVCVLLDFSSQEDFKHIKGQELIPIWPLICTFFS